MRVFGIDIVPHRQRMHAEDLGEKFKDPTDPLRLVFLCAMLTCPLHPIRRQLKVLGADRIRRDELLDHIPR